MDGIALDSQNSRITRHIAPFVLTPIAGATGYLAWHGDVSLIGVALFMPALWALAPTRLSAFLVAFTYYLVAARDIPAGAAVFFGQGEAFGWSLLLSASLLLALPFTLLWQTKPTAWRIWVALALVSLPPIGIVGWTNPLTAAGLLLPGYAWAGLLITILMVGLIVRVPLTVLPIVGYTLIMPAPAPSAPTGWRALNTSFLMASGERDFVEDARRQQVIIDRLFALDDSVIVLPETIVGRWSEASMFLWGDYAARAADRGQVVILGAEVDDGRGYKNAAVQLTRDGASLRYQQLMPVPISMWRPWSNDGASPAWFEQQSFVVDEHRAAFLICYEQLLFWPPLVAASTSPDVFIGMTNGWWARGTDIPAIQESAVTAWAALFGTKLVHAVNL